MDSQGAPKHDPAAGRPLYLYDLPTDILVSLQLKNDGDGQETATAPETVERPSTPASESSVGAQGCSLCSLSFVTVQDQRSHTRSDLHAYNLKQKLRGAKPVTEGEFETLIGTLDESLSGSDASESDPDDDASRKDSTLAALLKRQATLADRSRVADEEEADKKTRGLGNAPLMWFSSASLPENHYYGVYRAVFAPQELSTEATILEGVKTRQLEPIAMPKPAKDGSGALTAYKGRHIFLCMIGGGHFAAMVVSLAPRKSRHGAASGPLNREATVLAHKTFHRYTTRRRQGGSQSASDNAKGAAHSAGATLRRYNEQALTDDVRALLLQWKGLLDSADLLFVRATGTTNRTTLFGPHDGQVLRANDARLRGFPFTTRRATQNELMRAFIELTRLKVREITPATASATSSEGAAKATAPSKPKPSPARLTEEEETALLHTTQLQALIRRSKLPALLAYLKNNELPADFQFQPADTHHHAPTALHFAASQNAAALIAGLVVRGGADPAAPNRAGRTPFELAGDRATRDAFRVARAEAGENRWAWDAARVPPALSREEAERREERERREAKTKEAERRREEEERLRAAERAAPPVGGGKKLGGGSLLGSIPRKTAQEVREEEARGLTPETRVQLERERRARAAEERMRRMQAGE